MLAFNDFHETKAVNSVGDLQFMLKYILVQLCEDLSRYRFGGKYVMVLTKAHDFQ